MRSAACACLLSAVLTVATPAVATAQTSVVASAGLFDTAAWLFDGDESRAVEAGLALHGAPRAWGIAPAAGGAVSFDGAAWVFVGAYRPVELGRGWRLTPGFGAAVYHRGRGKELGGHLQFRSAIGVSHRGSSGTSIGLEFYHLSNGNLSPVNPGTNSLLVTLGVPVPGG